MSNYSQLTSFTPKDSLPTGNPSKVIQGAEFDGEFNAISVAIASKADTSTVSALSSTVSALDTEVDGKQATLVSGTNIKTVNSTSLLGSGDLAVGDVLIATAQTLTAPKRGTITTDNDLSFDLNVTNNFTCTTSGSGTLTFTNITAGQSGFILLVNASNHTISAAATTKVSSTLLTRISASGTYLLSYFSNGTNVYVVSSEAFT